MEQTYDLSFLSTDFYTSDYTRTCVWGAMAQKMYPNCASPLFSLAYLLQQGIEVGIRQHYFDDFVIYSQLLHYEKTGEYLHATQFIIDNDGNVRHYLSRILNGKEVLPLFIDNITKRDIKYIDTNNVRIPCIDSVLRYWNEYTSKYDKVPCFDLNLCKYFKKFKVYEDSRFISTELIMKVLKDNKVSVSKALTSKY